MKKIPEGYIETELGVIPQEWEIRKLFQIVKNRSEKYNPNKEESFPYIALEHIEQEIGRINGSGTSNETTSTKSVFYKNDILFGKLRPYLKKYWLSNFDGVCSTEILVLQGIENVKYVFYLLQTNNFIEDVSKKAFGTKMPRTSWNDIRDFLFAVPPLPEQQKIAEILSSVDDHIEKLDETISEYELLKKGMMKKLLTEGIGHTEFKDTEIGRIPKEWEVRKVKEICNISTGKKNTQDKKDEGIYPFFVRSDKIEKINSFSYDGEAVLTAGDGVGTGKVFHYINGKFDVHQRVYKMTEFREIQGYFFYLYFSQNFYDRVKRMSAKTSVDSVRMDMISEMDIAVPHENEQKEISQIIYLMTERIDLFKSEKEDFVKVKKGLMEKLLTGKIRV